jgi:ubiquinone biosynthesis protein Coq4
MPRFQELLKAAGQLRLLAAVGRSGGELSRVADLVDSLIDSPQMDLCLERFRALPGGAALLAERYPPLQPDLPRLLACPLGSLGRRYAQLIQRLDYDPEFFRPRQLTSDAHWLTQRIATTHDIHHVVSGFATTPPGEAGVLAITATQIGFPAYVLLVQAGLLSYFATRPNSLEEFQRAVAHGTSLGFSAAPLCVARWEEGWDWPVERWRDQLGLLRLADGEAYGLPLASS